MHYVRVKEMRLLLDMTCLSSWTVKQYLPGDMSIFEVNMTATKNNTLRKTMDTCTKCTAQYPEGFYCTKCGYVPPKQTEPVLIKKAA